MYGSLLDSELRQRQRNRPKGTVTMFMPRDQEERRLRAGVSTPIQPSPSELPALKTGARKEGRVPLSELNISNEAAQQIARASIERRRALQALSECEAKGAYKAAREERLKVSEAEQTIDALIAAIESGQD
jgi:hypothetical protein